MKTCLLPLAALLAFGCLFDSGKGKGHSFVGEWHANREFAFTLGDSLSEDSLTKFLMAGGFDLDSILSGGWGYTYDTAKFDILIRGFEWNCPAGIDCTEILSTSSSRRRFSADSMTVLRLKNQAVVGSYTVAYSYSDDSLFSNFTEDFHTSEPYDFLGSGDTLRFFYDLDSLGLMVDTLIRQR